MRGPIAVKSDLGQQAPSLEDGPQFAIAKQGLDDKVSPYTWLAQRVDNNGCADPVSTCVLYQAVGAQSLASGVDPVVDEEDTFASGQ